MDYLQSLPGAWIDDAEERQRHDEKEDIHLLKRTIETLQKEKERLEETNHIVKKSIRVVTEKRLLAEQARLDRKLKGDDYIIIMQEHVPTQDELIASGIEGWEWISAC
ncbi:unnamed protein product [Rhizopus stolonifer]